MTSNRPAILGGDPAIPAGVPFARPSFEPGTERQALEMIEATLRSGMLTNGPLVRQLEEAAAKHFEVDHCVAVSSCTVGLMLVIQAVGGRRAVLPSFTFSATAHAAHWNGLETVFADCDPATWNLTEAAALDAMGDARADVVIGVHISGVPCDVQALEDLARQAGATLIFDAAHGAGSLTTVDGVTRPLGAFGTAEVFSLTPTKVLSSAEGGLIATNDADLAQRLRIARDYGNPGNYDTQFPGLNARLSELHAALAIVSLEQLAERVARRNAIAAEYRRLLGPLPGIRFQHVPTGDRSSYKDFTVLVDAETFGVSRDGVVAALAAEGVPTRPYYSPPVHRQTAYRHVPTGPLPVTDGLAEQVISLPMFSDLSHGDIALIAAAFEKIHRAGEEVDAALTD